MKVAKIGDTPPAQEIKYILHRHLSFHQSSIRANEPVGCRVSADFKLTGPCVGAIDGSKQWWWSWSALSLLPLFRTFGEGRHSATGLSRCRPLTDEQLFHCRRRDMHLDDKFILVAAARVIPVRVAHSFVSAAVEQFLVICSVADSVIPSVAAAVIPHVTAAVVTAWVTHKNLPALEKLVEQMDALLGCEVTWPFLEWVRLPFSFELIQTLRRRWRLVELVDDLVSACESLLRELVKTIPE